MSSSSRPCPRMCLTPRSLAAMRMWFRQSSRSVSDMWPDPTEFSKKWEKFSLGVLPTVNAAAPTWPVRTESRAAWSGCAGAPLARVCTGKEAMHGAEGGSHSSGSTGATSQRGKRQGLRGRLTCSMISSAKRCAPPATEPYQRSATAACGSHALPAAVSELAVQISSTRAIMKP